jgi:hypothetical protein
MKKANNNEMDLILRGLAKSRRNDSHFEFGAAISENNGDDSNHLDADELNSFAEGLLPEPARVRYMEHLADCANCRKLVVSLKQAAGDLSPPPIADKQARPGFWQRFTAVFSPQVLRYAVPALALTVVIGIGLFVMRERSSQDFVATQRTQIPEAQSGQPQSVAEALATPGKETSVASQTPLESRQSTSSGNQRNDAQPGQVEINKPQANTGLVSGAPVAKDIILAPPPVAIEPGVAQTQPLYSPEPKTGVAYDAGRVVLNDAKKAEASKEEQPNDRLAQQRERDESSFKRGKEGEDKTAAPGVAATSGPRRAEARMSAVRPAAKAKQDSDDDETRSVSGKRFRRQGNIWVDSTYESSRATISVSRGSEQFRALVADEPGIRTIANQLGGDIIVVWKGKAYRIR